mmetsp:Transcript_48699/g.62507  ORF Transcript_48699/g.62507 Transcript_48699/m.62507 type:complete len:167 (-) Transcript_48699:219-719(-)
MHATISEKVRASFRRQMMIGYAQFIGVVLTCSSAVGGSLYLHLPHEASIILATTGLVGSGASFWFTKKVLEDEERRLLSSNGLNVIFESTYSGQIGEGDAWILSDWQRIRDRLQLNLKGIGLNNAEGVSNSELKELKSILNDEIPKLRRLAAPIDYSEMVKDGFSK